MKNPSPQIRILELQCKKVRNAKSFYSCKIRKSKQTCVPEKLNVGRFDNIFLHYPPIHLESKIDKHCAKAYTMWSMIAWQHFLHKALMHTVPCREIVPKDERSFGLCIL